MVKATKGLVQEKSPQKLLWKRRGKGGGRTGAGKCRGKPTKADGDVRRKHL